MAVDSWGTDRPATAINACTIEKGDEKDKVICPFYRGH